MFSMFMPNQAQVGSAVRWVLGLLTVWLAGKGWIGESFGSSILALSPSISMFIWSLWAKRPTGLVAAAAAIPEVTTIMTTPAIANSTSLNDDPKVLSTTR